MSADACHWCRGNIGQAVNPGRSCPLCDGTRRVIPDREATAVALYEAHRVQQREPTTAWEYLGKGGPGWGQSYWLRLARALDKEDRP